MNSNEFGATPSVADESSMVVDDEEVISKTLPSAQMPLSAGGRLDEQVDHVLNLIRGSVIRQPIRAVLVAAAGGAALTALLGAWIHRENN